MVSGIPTSVPQSGQFRVGADVALPLWVLHTSILDAGDISPFMVLGSPM
jgi:hypothetical protein